MAPELEEFRAKGREHGGGNPAEAIESFESAARLDPAATEIKALLQEARSTAEKLREAARLSEDADRALREGDPASASRLAQQALEFAQDDPRARKILESARAALAQERERARLADALGQARRLIQIRSWNDAFLLLGQMSVDFPGVGEVRALLEEARVGEERDQRERSLAGGLAGARQEIQQGDLQSALTRLKALVEQFRESAEAADMLGFVRTEIEAKARRTLVEGALQEARSAFASGDFPRAVKTLENALLRYPADQELQRERRRMVAEQREAVRKEAADKALAVATQMRSQGQWPEALVPLNEFLKTHGAASAIVDLREAILRDQEAAKRREELHEFIERKNELLERGELGETVTLLLRPPAHLKDEPEVAQLLGAARLQLDQQNERKAAVNRGRRTGARVASPCGWASNSAVMTKIVERCIL